MLNVARKLMRGSQAYRGGNRLLVHSGHSSSTKSDVGCCATGDLEGNVFLWGHCSTDNVPSTLAKFSPGGGLLWQRKVSMTARFVASGGLAVDTSGNSYVLGQAYVTTTPDLPHLLKYNSAGTLQWQRKLTTATTTNVKSVVVDGSGNTYLALTENTATSTGLVAKYNTSGTLQWQRKLSSTYTVQLSAAALASDGGVIAVGYFMDGGSGASYIRGFVVKYDSSGAIQWQTKVHWGIQGGMYGVAVDSVTGDIYLTGSYTSGSEYGVLVKLNSSGTHQWSRRHTVASTSDQSAVVDPSTGYVYVGGDLGRVMCFDASGNFVWERNFTADGGTAVSISYSKCLGICNGELLIAATASHTSVSQSNDMVLIRMSPNGGAAATAGYISMAVPAGFTPNTTAATTAAAGLTDAAGAHTDAAGGATDAAGTLTFTNYSN